MAETQRAMLDFATILTTLDEILGDDGPDFIPATQVYLLLESDIGRYEDVARMLRASRTANVTSQTIAITARGRAVAQMINEAAKECAA